MGGRLDRNQDQVIEGAMEGDRRLTVFLKNGVPLRGKILAHDSYTIFMETEKAQALVYKHSVTSLRPARLKGPGPGAGAGGGERSGGASRPGGARGGGAGHGPGGHRSQGSGAGSAKPSASKQAGSTPPGPNPPVPTPEGPTSD